MTYIKYTILIICSLFSSLFIANFQIKAEELPRYYPIEFSEKKIEMEVRQDIVFEPVVMSAQEKPDIKTILLEHNNL